MVCLYLKLRNQNGEYKYVSWVTEVIVSRLRQRKIGLQPLTKSTHFYRSVQEDVSEYNKGQGLPDPEQNILLCKWKAPEFHKVMEEGRKLRKYTTVSRNLYNVCNLLFKIFSPLSMWAFHIHIRQGGFVWPLSGCQRDYKLGRFKAECCSVTSGQAPWALVLTFSKSIYLFYSNLFYATILGNWPLEMVNYIATTF